MGKYLRSLAKGFKILSVSSVTLSLLGYGYLQYINSIIGPLHVDKQNAMEFYKTHHKMSEGEAARTYYWVIYKISEARVLGFWDYTSYCSKLNNKIIRFSLENYQKENILDEINKAGPLTANSEAHQRIYRKIQEIRAKNAENVQDRDYLIKGTMDHQKNFNSNVIPGISEETKEQVQRIYNYTKEASSLFKDPSISKNAGKNHGLDHKFEKDFLYRVLLI